jgi:hypothetical protein
MPGRKSREPWFSKKTHQLNVRFTTEEMRQIARISELEDRDYSYIVQFFTRFGMDLYDQLGPLAVFRSAKISAASRNGIRQAVISRLNLREEVSNGDVDESATGHPAVKRQTHRTG